MDQSSKNPNESPESTGLSHSSGHSTPEHHSSGSDEGHSHHSHHSHSGEHHRHHVSEEEEDRRRAKRESKESYQARMRAHNFRRILTWVSFVLCLVLLAGSVFLIIQVNKLSNALSELNGMKSDIASLKAQVEKLKSEAGIVPPDPLVPLPAAPSYLISDQYYFTTGRSTEVYSSGFFPHGIAECSALYLCDAPGFRQTETGFLFQPASEGTWELTIRIRDQYDRTVLERKTLLIATAPLTEEPRTVLLLGDSRIAGAGTQVSVIGGTLLSLPEGNIVCVGTRTDKNDVPHEGRAGWHASDYLFQERLMVSGGRVELPNPFYDPNFVQKQSGIESHFHFSYYLETQDIEMPDAVVIFLGANDDYSTKVAEYLSIMIQSIREAAAETGKDVTVFLMSEYFTVTSGYDKNVISADLSARLEKQIKLDEKLISVFEGRESEGIVLVPTQIVVGQTEYPTGDNGLVNDAVHLSEHGSEKAALLLASYIYQFCK